MKESMNEKIAKLLRLAERAGTPAEAEAASRAAERLMTKWGIDEAMLRSNLGENSKPESIVTKGTAPFPKLFVKPRTHLACAVVHGMGNMKPYLNPQWDGTVIVKVVGWESDVDRALQFIPSIVLQADHAMAHWWKSEPYHKVLTAAQAKNAKRQFLFGFAAVVKQRLEEMRQEEVDKQPGSALVLYDRGKLVDEEYNKLSLKKGRGVRAGSVLGGAEGRAAGARANLGGPSIGGSRKALGG